MSNKQVSNISWNIHLSYNDEWRTLDDVIQHIRGIFSRYEIKYCCYSKEMGKQGVTPHIQGFTQFSRRYSYKKVFEDWHVNNKVFVEQSKGNAWENFQYIMKEGIEFFEFGARPKEVCKKSSNDGVSPFGEAIRLAREGRWEELESERPAIYLRYRGALERVRQEVDRPLSREVKCFWLVGSPGSGKSRFAFSWNVDDVYIKNPSNRWFDGYKDQSILFVDDIDISNASQLSYNLKIWGDRYPVLAEYKGGVVYLKHTVVLITSNYRIDTLFTDPELRTALHRRYKEIVVLDHRETPDGLIEIKTPDEQNPMLIKWLNKFNILDLI